MDPDTSASRGNYHAHEHIGRTEDVDHSFMLHSTRASTDSPLSNRSKRVFGHYAIDIIKSRGEIRTTFKPAGSPAPHPGCEDAIERSTFTLVKDAVHLVGEEGEVRDRRRSRIGDEPESLFHRRPHDCCCRVKAHVAEM